LPVLEEYASYIKTMFQNDDLNEKLENEPLPPTTTTIESEETAPPNLDGGMQESLELEPQIKKKTISTLILSKENQDISVASKLGEKRQKCSCFRQ